MIQDKLGVYRVGDLKFYSKLEAIEMHVKTGIHPHWDFNEDVYSSYDWTIEPPDDILELYRKRAEQLRSQYDYIILMYSGGSDSHTVLDTFLKNNIKLDEIASQLEYNITGKKDSYPNAEIFRVAFPVIKECKEKYPWFKDVNHRALDSSDFIIDYFSDKKTRLDWIYKANMFLTLNHVARNEQLLKLVPEWAKLIDQGKKVCILWGADKPRMSHEDGKFIFNFMDFHSQGSVDSIAGKASYTDEFFYWTPDMPEISIKQAHMIKNYLNSRADVTTLPFVSTHKSGLVYKVVDGVKYWLSVDGVNTIIYPNWDINTFSVGKPPSIILSPRDYWVLELEDSNPVKTNWINGVQKYSEIIPDYWKNDPNDFIGGGIMHSVSKNYFLES